MMNRRTRLIRYIVIANVVALFTALFGLVQGIAKSSDSLPVLQKLGIMAVDHSVQVIGLAIFLIFNLMFVAIWLVEGWTSTK